MDSPAIPSLDAAALSARLADGSLGAAELMDATLARIDAVNPALNAIVSLRPRAELMAEAEAADLRPSQGWLHGIPFAIKDLADTRGLRTTYGSPSFAGHVPDADSLMVRRIRAAGAIVIGKTNTPEWGLGSHSYNPVFGVTRNPYDTAKSAGGSSGGAAAALAARLVAVADGSDMMGSLRNPAAFNNVYGFRPTYGRVPSEPTGDAFLHQLSVSGPMARTPRDLALLLDTLAGPEPTFPHSLPAHRSFTEDLARPVSGLRIGWLGDWNGFFPMEPGILELTETALGVFERLGVAVEPIVPDFDPERLWQAWLTLRHFAVANELKPLFRAPAERARLKPEAVWEVENGLSLSADAVHEASVARTAWNSVLARLFARFDGLVLPSAQVFPFDAGLHWPSTVGGRKMDTYHQWMAVVMPVSIVGLPAVALPAGFGSAGLPAGFQLFGRRGEDALMLNLAEAYHRMTDWPGRRPPQLPPSNVPRAP
ncbi:MAG: amidase [Rhizobiaceae bacterium]